MKAKLPFKTTLRLAMQGKTVTKIMTVFLCAFSFALFALASTGYLYNKKDYYARALLHLAENSGVTTFSSNLGDTLWQRNIERIENATGWDFAYYYRWRGTEDIFGAELNHFQYDYVFYEEELTAKEQRLPEYQDIRSKGAPSPLVIGASLGEALGYQVLAGRYPEAENEICVSSYFYESCKAGEVFPLEENGSLSDKGVTLGEPDDLLGQELLLNGQRYVVSGVFDSGTIPEKFEALLASDAYDSLYYALRTFTREGLQGAALISETAAADFREALRSSAPSGNDPFDTSGLRYYLSPFPSEEEQELWAVDRFQIADEQIPYEAYCLPDTSTLADDQFIAPLSFVARLCRALAENGTQELAALSDSLTQLETAPPAEQKTLLEKTMALWRSYGELSVPLLKEVFDEKTEQPGLEDLGSYAVVGFYLEENDGFFCSEQFYEGLTISRTAHKITSAYTPEEDALYQYAFLLMPHNEGELKGIFDRLDGVDTRDVSYGLVNALASTVESVGHTVETLSLVFLVIGLIFMTFAALLLLNFIIISIAGKQREIGILRAVGARGLDVFKIFFAESGILVGSCLVFSLFGTAIAAAVLNHILKEQLGLAVSVFLVGPLSVLLMAAVAAAVALLGTIFPVFFAARKKPVDTIRSL